MDLQQLFNKIASLKVGIIGDVMLDTYMWGNVDRISPEAPVPIVSLQKKEQRIGGAGNVALNIQSLEARAFVITVTGDDEDAKQLNTLFQENNINTHYSFASADRITTNKTRVISRNQQMMRLDAEITNDLTTSIEEEILSRFELFVQKEKPDIVILEDYNKGVLTEAVIRSVISICRKNNILTAVDPKRKNFFEYKHVDLFKPNLKEAREALNIISDGVNISLLQNIHAELNNILQNEVSLITLSEKGMFYQQQNHSAIIPSHLRNIADVSGAGDTVIATAALTYAATKDINATAEIANIAGGLVCEEVGTVAINRQKLIHECEALLL
jgi:rfaE bifunctional protein kinase chain/domain